MQQQQRERPRWWPYSMGVSQATTTPEGAATLREDDNGAPLRGALRGILFLPQHHIKKCFSAIFRMGRGLSYTSTDDGVFPGTHPVN